MAPGQACSTTCRRSRTGGNGFTSGKGDQHATMLRPLYPNHLLGDAAWKRYTDSMTTKRKELEIRLRSFNSSLLGRAGPSSVLIWPEERENRNEAVESCLGVLYCVDTLSPLFIYCVAVNLSQNHPAYARDAEMLWSRHTLE